MLAAERVNSAARAAHDDMIERLVRWCGIPSDAGDVDGLHRMAAAVREEFSHVGAAVLEPVGPAVLSAVRVRSSDRPRSRILLVGHYDTVPHDGDRAEPLVVADDERIVARGAADMKGGLTVMLEALKLIERLDPDPPAWEVVAVPDEEIGTPWSRGLLARAAEGACAALVFEPALPDGRIVRARKGVGTLTIEAMGRSAHAGRNPEDGRSAIAALAELVGSAESLADADAGTVVTVTTIRGGSAANVVPASARAEIDVRVDRAPEAERVVEGVRAAARRVELRREVAFVVSGGVHRPPMPTDPGARQLFELYRRSAAEIGLRLDWVDVGGGSDANILAATGIPTLDGLGVVGGDLHAPGEYAVADSLVERASLAAVSMSRLGRAKDLGASR